MPPPPPPPPPPDGAGAAPAPPAYWRPTSSSGDLAPPPGRFDAVQHLIAASRSPFAAASPPAAIAGRRLAGRTGTADVTGAREAPLLAGEFGDLGAALALPPGARLPAMSPASALAQEAARLAQSGAAAAGAGAPLLLPEVAQAQATRFAQLADARWAAQLALRKADKAAGRA